MFWIYIIESEKTNEYYIGYTENLAERLRRHNANRERATRGKGPWNTFYTEEYSSEAEAIGRERQIKRWKSRKAIERLKFGTKWDP